MLLLLLCVCVCIGDNFLLFFFCSSVIFSFLGVYFHLFPSLLSPFGASERTPSRSPYRLKARARSLPLIRIEVNKLAAKCWLCCVACAPTPFFRMILCDFPEKVWRRTDSYIFIAQWIGYHLYRTEFWACFVYVQCYTYTFWAVRFDYVFTVETRNIDSNQCQFFLYSHPYFT